MILYTVLFAVVLWLKGRKPAGKTELAVYVCIAAVGIGLLLWKTAGAGYLAERILGGY